MKFPQGPFDRVKQNADWKCDALGTVTAFAQERTHPEGSTETEYWIPFDSPQSDSTDELHVSGIEIRNG